MCSRLSSPRTPIRSLTKSSDPASAPSKILCSSQIGRQLIGFQEISGQADAEATRIYAAAYNRDAAFYAFLKSLETYELTADPNSILILTTDSDLMKFMKAKQ